MDTPYAKVTIEEFDGETAQSHSLTWYKVGNEALPCIEEVVAAIAVKETQNRKRGTRWQTTIKSPV